MLLVDSADLELLNKALRAPFVRGFTTNPNLMARSAYRESIGIAEYVELAKILCTMRLEGIAPSRMEVMIQGIGKADEIEKQATEYVSAIQSQAVDVRLWIKLMPTQESIGCISRLKGLGCSTLVTAVYSATQASVAMDSGADGVAVYLGRLMQFEELWQQRVERIANVLSSAKKMLLLASFPDLETIEKALDYSLDLTVPPSLLACLLDSPHSTEAGLSFDRKVSF